MLSIILAMIIIVIVFNLSNRVSRLEDEVRILKATQEVTTPLVIDGFNKSVGR